MVVYYVRIAGEDFGPLQSYNVTFPAGLVKQSVNIPIINDDIYETTETFQLEISVPKTAVEAGVINGCTSKRSVEIIDDDGKLCISITFHYTIPCLL